MELEIITKAKECYDLLQRRDDLKEQLDHVNASLKELHLTNEEMAEAKQLYVDVKAVVG